MKMVLMDHSRLHWRLSTVGEIQKRPILKNIHLYDATEYDERDQDDYSVFALYFVEATLKPSTAGGATDDEKIIAYWVYYIIEFHGQHRKN